MEKLANRISEFIAKKLNYDEEKTKVMAYGLAAIFQMVSIFIISSIIGLLAGFWIESMFIFLGVGLLRKSTGGAHSQTFQGCMIISIFSIAFLSFVSRYMFPVRCEKKLYFFILILIGLIYLFAFIMVYILAPVATPNKPIVKKEKIRRLKINSIITVIVYFVISLLFFFFSKKNLRFVNISISLSLATLWQIFTLTKAGHKFIDIVDKKFRS